MQELDYAGTAADMVLRLIIEVFVLLQPAVPVQRHYIDCALALTYLRIQGKLPAQILLAQSLTNRIKHHACSAFPDAALAGKMRPEKTELLTCATSWGSDTPLNLSLPRCTTSTCT